jgi:hypothetical protein
MLQGGQQDAPIKVSPGVTLVEASRSPFHLSYLIQQGRFGPPPERCRARQPSAQALMRSILLHSRGPLQHSRLSV